MNAVLLINILIAYSANINKERQVVLLIILVIGRRSLNIEPSKNLAYAIIKALLDASINIKKLDIVGFTLLYRQLEIIQFRIFQIFTLLLKRRVNIDRVSLLGKTLLTYAYSIGREYNTYYRIKVIKLLIVYKANIYILNKNKDTPLIAFLQNYRIKKKDKLELIDTLYRVNIKVNIVGHLLILRMYKGSI